MTYKKTFATQKSDKEYNDYVYVADEVTFNPKYCSQWVKDLINLKESKLERIIKPTNIKK